MLEIGSTRNAEIRIFPKSGKDGDEDGTPIPRRRPRPWLSWGGVASHMRSRQKGTHGDCSGCPDVRHRAPGSAATARRAARSTALLIELATAAWTTVNLRHSKTLIGSKSGSRRRNLAINSMAMQRFNSSVAACSRQKRSAASFYVVSRLRGTPVRMRMTSSSLSITPGRSFRLQQELRCG
jgi:hypothetical protein